MRNAQHKSAQVAGYCRKFYFHTLLIFQSGSKTPVAVVKAQPQDRSKEKASRFISNMLKAYQETPDIQQRFTDLLKKHRDSK